AALEVFDRVAHAPPELAADLLVREPALAAELLLRREQRGVQLVEPLPPDVALVPRGIALERAAIGELTLDALLLELDAEPGVAIDRRLDLLRVVLRIGAIEQQDRCGIDRRMTCVARVVGETRLDDRECGYDSVELGERLDVFASFERELEVA